MTVPGIKWPTIMNDGTSSGLFSRDRSKRSATILTLICGGLTATGNIAQRNGNHKKYEASYWRRIQRQLLMVACRATAIMIRLNKISLLPGPHLIGGSCA